MSFQRIAGRVFPVVKWLPEYSAQKAICDLISGITVGLTLIPQSIAYAALAGLGPEFGLYSSLVGGVSYMIFGQIAELNIAPTAILSLLTYSYTHEVSYSPESAAILLCFYAGIVEIACGVLHLGFLVDFVSTPVVAGFTSAGAMTIAASQVKNLLGIKFQAESFVHTVYNVFLHIGETKVCDALLSIVCCLFLFGFREIKRFGSPPNFDKNTKEQNNGWKTFLWFLSVSRNALVVITCAVVAYVLKSYDLVPFTLTGPVPDGLPDIYLPFEPTNGTVKWDLLEATKELGTGIIVVPFVAILSNVAIAKAFANGKVLDASQEMLAVGVCNLFGSFLGSFPVCASFSRAAVNNASGARTPFGGIYAGILVILSLTFLTPYFSYIPKPTLSSVLFCAVIFIIEFHLSKLIWKVNKMDFLPLFITVIACLSLSIEIGILVGIVVDLGFVLYFTARPKVEIDRIKHTRDFEYLKVSFVGGLLYASAEYVREVVMKEYRNNPDGHPKYIIFDCSYLRKIDFTAAKCLDSLATDVSKMGTNVAFYDAIQSVETILERTMGKNSNFLHGSQGIENFFEAKELWNFNCINTNGNANINTAFEPDSNEMVVIK